MYAIRGSTDKRSRVERTVNSTSRQKRAWMFGKWTNDPNEHVSGYDNVSPPSAYRPNFRPQYFEPQPPAFGYENPTAAVQEFQPTCEFFVLG